MLLSTLRSSSLSGSTSRRSLLGLPTRSRTRKVRLVYFRSSPRRSRRVSFERAERLRPQAYSDELISLYLCFEQALFSRDSELCTASRTGNGTRRAGSDLLRVWKRRLDSASQFMYSHIYVLKEDLDLIILQLASYPRETPTCLQRDAFRDLRLSILPSYFFLQIPILLLHLWCGISLFESSSYRGEADERGSIRSGGFLSCFPPSSNLASPFSFPPTNFIETDFKSHMDSEDADSLSPSETLRDNDDTNVSKAFASCFEAQIELNELRLPPFLSFPRS